jgi:membrane glycosyltransferase
MELHTSPRVSGSVPVICERYLDRLTANAELRQALLRKIADAPGPDADGAESSLSALHAALSDERFDRTHPAQSSVPGRIQIAYGMEIAAQVDPDANPMLASAPPLHRSPMAPVNWPPHPFKALVGRAAKWLPLGEKARRYAGKDAESDSPDPRGHWHRSASRRRITLLLLVIAQSALATYSMTAVLPYHGEKPLEIAIMGLFAMLCAWISAGFWTALMGYFVLQFRGDRYSISATAAPDAPIPPEARTAIVMPICNEHVQRVMAGLRSTYESLDRSGNLQHFDFYILSDSNDADTRVAEVEAWLELCRAVYGFGRIFYRWRKHRISRKSGNIADFCRRWGADYRYMVVMDADSVMTGASLSRLVQLMEANPNAGLIQTGPTAAGRDTFYARLQQFASRVYGPLYLTGLHFWQLGESHYWGHNAIIRVAPFIKHCALGRLPGKGSLSGEILSHDFVEAALMRKAGWAVWIVYDLPGSYEEMPPNLLDELNRDRRWCHGNLMNFRLFWAPGFHVAHRAVFMTGVIAYVSALLWLTFLLLSTGLLAYHTLVEPEYFVQPNQLFPVWPEWHPERALMLFGVTAAWLFLPKILSVLLILLRGAREYGDGIRLVISMFIEWVFSMLMAPVRMLFHTQFVLAALTGLRIQWKSPPREDAATPWSMALRRHGWHSVLGVVWGVLVYWLNPSYLVWMTPILGALALSVPISVITSSPLLGRKLRRLGLFLIPEESNPPEELRALQQELAYVVNPNGFTEAVADPGVNALACAVVPARHSVPEPLLRTQLHLVDHALRTGPVGLRPQEKLLLLNDAALLSQLHFRVWTSPHAHPDWLNVKVAASEMKNVGMEFAQPAYI